MWMKDDQLTLEGSEWIVKITYGVHNYPPIEYLDGHSYVGRLSENKTFVVI